MGPYIDCVRSYVTRSYIDCVRSYVMRSYKL
jgi:hypothetical protein